MKTRIALALTLTLTLTACVESEDDLGTDDLGTDTQAVTPCPKLWGCGENSPVMGPWEFHELDTAGTPNLEGVRLLGLVQGGQLYSVHVTGAQLYATSGAVTLSGTALVGAYLWLSTPDGFYKIFFNRVTPRASSNSVFWVGPPNPIETYELTYNHWTGDPRPLCNSAPSRLSGEDNNRYWYHPLEAVIFTGDRYDSRLKTVTAASYAAAGTWFNIGCAGSAIAKLLFTRHATAGATRDYPSSLNRRQAMLKMYVADICGTGTAYTVKGTPLHWENLGGWSHLDGTEFAHEALWDQNGAICMDTHRLGSTYKAEYEAECALPAVDHPLPSCAGLPLPGSGAYLSSAVPDPVM